MREGFYKTVMAVCLGPLIGAVAFLVAATAQIHGTVDRLRGPVCYAQTEDSSLIGCDYHDGAWWPSR